mgnify:CR=1 FL=1
MKVGDLVWQLGWEADGIGVVIGYAIERHTDDRVTVQWPNGVVEMYRSQLRTISEGR